MALQVNFRSLRRQFVTWQNWIHFLRFLCRRRQYSCMEIPVMGERQRRMIFWDPFAEWVHQSWFSLHIFCNVSSENLALNQTKSLILYLCLISSPVCLKMFSYCESMLLRYIFVTGNGSPEVPECLTLLNLSQMLYVKLTDWLLLGVKWVVYIPLVLQLSFFIGFQWKLPWPDWIFI